MNTKTVICKKCGEVMYTEIWGMHKKDFTVYSEHEWDCVSADKPWNIKQDEGD